MSTSWIEELQKNYQKASQQKTEAELKEEAKAEQREADIQDQVSHILNDFLPGLFKKIQENNLADAKISVQFSTPFLCYRITGNSLQAPYDFEAMRIAAEMAAEFTQERLIGWYEPPENDEDAEKIIFELDLQ